MPIRLRKPIRIGPQLAHVKLNFTQNGFTSWSVKVGPWSWNSRAEKHRVDLPGPWHWTSKKRSKR